MKQTFHKISITVRDDMYVEIAQPALRLIGAVDDNAIKATIDAGKSISVFIFQNEIRFLFSNKITILMKN